MDYQQIIARLLQGSSNLNRMEKEILEVTKMLSSFALRSTVGDDPHDVDERFESTKFKFAWYIKGRIGNTANAGLEINCTLLKGDGGEDIVFGTWRPGHFSPDRSSFLQTLYATLPELVEEMAKIFPRIHETWKPLIMASSVNFPKGTN